MRVTQGQVVWAQLNPILGHEQGGHRPVLVVSEDRFNERSGTVIVMPLTSQQPKAGAPFSLDVGLVGNRRAWVKPAQIRTISTARLGAALGLVMQPQVERCLDALLQVCGRRAGSVDRSDNDG